MKYGTSYTLQVKASDADGEVLTFSTEDLPAYATVANPENGLFNITFAPTSRQRGAINMTVFVQDSNGGRDAFFQY